MRRFAQRFARPLAFILIAAQLLLAVPAEAVAAAQSHASVTSQTHCESMGSADQDDHCPCCPDDADSMNDCLTTCNLVVAIAPSLHFDHVPAPAAQTYLEPTRLTPALSEPPLKPPPIA
jgi:hypothetical protein